MVAVVPVEEPPVAAGSGAVGTPLVAQVNDVGGVSAGTAEYVIVDFPGYVGPVMVAGHPTWVCVPKLSNRHEKFRGWLARSFLWCCAMA